MLINDTFLQEMKQQHQKQQQRKHQYVLEMDSTMFCGLPHYKTF